MTGSAMTGTKVEQPMPECWRLVGVTGDRSCPELAQFIHCRNCPVLAEAARKFFDRPAPPGYLESWQAILDEPEQRPESDATSLLVFRLDKEWFAIPASALVEVAPIRPIHSVPHRTNTALAGLVNIRGRLELCVSLHAVLGVSGEPKSPPREGQPSENDDGVPRLLVLERRHSRSPQRWVLGVDDVAGVYRVTASATRPLPSTVGQAASHCSTALFDDGTRAVAVLDEDRLFDALAHAVVA